MAFKTILVYVDTLKACSERLALACALARREEAHLIGLHVIRQVSYPSYVAAEIPASVIDQQRQYLAERAKEAKAKFDAAAATVAETVHCEWRCLESPNLDMVEGVVHQARYADLVIVGQGYADDSDAVADDMPERLLLESGRPLLVVPYAGHFPSLGEHAMIAWNSSRESTRAVFDSLPLLAAAKSVKILSINPDTSDEGDGEGPLPGSDIALTLARHGIKAEVQQATGHDIGTGELLLSRLADEGCDLLVMGGYGHSRLRELVLGGATRTLLHEMTVPVLFSH